MSLILIIAFLLALIYKLYHFVVDKPPNTPPGIPRLPIWGSYWLLLWGNYEFPYETISYYVQKYKSKVISCYFGQSFAIIANDYKSIQEILYKKEFDGRPNDSYLAKVRSSGKLGIIFSEGSFWQEQRRFALHHLRNFGFGRRMATSENFTLEEIAVLIDTLKNGPINVEENSIVKDDGTALFPDVLYAFSANTIWNTIAGEKLGRDEYAKLRSLSRSAMVIQRKAESTSGAVNMAPWLRHIGDGFGFKEIIRGMEDIFDFTRVSLNKQTDMYNEEESRGFIGKYIQKLKQSEKYASNFSDDKRLLMVVADFTFPALSLIPSITTTYIKCLLHNPEVMHKVQNEIDAVVGRERLPTLDDRKALPYTEATIRESLRMETAVPLSVFHKCLESSTLCGYDVPVGTILVTNLAAMHKDPDLFEEPDKFIPERFLTEDGQLGKDYTLPFGAGRRLCPGETFARFNIFILVASLLQNFNFSFVKGQPAELKDKCPGLVITPKETWIRVTSRS